MDFGRFVNFKTHLNKRSDSHNYDHLQNDDDNNYDNDNHDNSVVVQWQFGIAHIKACGDNCSLRQQIGHIWLHTAMFRNNTILSKDLETGRRVAKALHGTVLNKESWPHNTWLHAV